ncbi:DUF1295 domain-containing protein [Chloropicon primus]|uniref:Uncharacterized protein n=2 Tax=Chloropicon primus TaxID=1764295 RepID=A0A5B8MRK2_9CHLO|nr:hypothetical protein A3770_10p57370 [Chloropicon primus]UPR02433.1 DUF1295 domain-containing protein [Chloropicon primus]|eukprot:QDZ23219.1 hypothetical protein A3770_10p57370 [Chloropicon primus]
MSFRKEKRGLVGRQNVALLQTLAVLYLYLSILLGRDRDGDHHQQETGIRHYLTSALGVVYVLRCNLMLRWLLPRAVSKEEIYFVFPVFLPVVLLSLAKGAKDVEREVTTVEALVALGLYAAGSWLSTRSEWQRKAWKERRENRGKCYTEGLFALSRNPNYLGDVVLFSGWALATGRWWTWWVPLFMGLSFVFYHIPEKEAYLASRYKAQWPAYKARTKALLPYIH